MTKGDIIYSLSPPHVKICNILEFQETIDLRQLKEIYCTRSVLTVSIAFQRIIIRVLKKFFSYSPVIFTIYAEKMILPKWLELDADLGMILLLSE